MAPPKLIIPCPFLKLNFLYLILSILCLVPISCTCDLYLIYMESLFQIYLPSKNLHLPLTLSYYLSPPFWLSTIFPLYFQNEWKNVIKIIKVFWKIKNNLPPLLLHSLRIFTKVICVGYKMVLTFECQHT